MRFYYLIVRNIFEGNQYYKEGEYSAIIDDVITTWHKDDYLKAVEARKATEQNHIAPEPKQKKVKDREER